MTRGFVVTVVELDDAEARDLPDKENLLVRVFKVGQVARDVLAAQNAELTSRIVGARDDLSPDTVFATRGTGEGTSKETCSAVAQPGTLRARAR